MNRLWRRKRHRSPFSRGRAGRLSVADGTPAPDRKEQHRVDRRERVLRSFAPAIAMMKATEPGTGDHRRRRRRLAFHCPSIRRVLVEGIVNPVVMMIVHVIANKPPEMLFFQRDDMIENLAAAASHPAFRNPILPGLCVDKTVPCLLISYLGLPPACQGPLRHVTTVSSCWNLSSHS